MKKAIILLFILTSILLCGCNGYREIDRGYLVTAIAFSQEDEKTNILIEAMSSSDVSDEKSQRVVLTGSGNDENEAYKNLKAALIKPLYFEQLGTVIFENTNSFDIEFLKKLPNLNFGIYVVQTENVNALFENESPNGVLGYDIIGLIRNYNKENDSKILCQFYKVNQNKNRLPTVNVVDGRLVVKNGGN